MHKFVFVLFLFLFCKTYNERIFTGIETTYNPDGSIILISTAKASEYSIEKNSKVMMETTSREAAQLLLKYELQKEEYKNKQFKISNIEFLDDGKYCKITAVSNP